MAHLDDDHIVDLISGGEGREDRRHLESCDGCARRAAAWQEVLSGLGELVAEPVNVRELHRLQTMYRVLGPARVAGTSWTARLVRSTEPAAVAVRGTAATELLELEAGPYTVLVQVTPAGAGAAAIHGQVLGLDSTETSAGRLVLHRDDGRAHIQELDELGEFHVEPIVDGAWHATWWVGDARIELDELRVGGGSEL